MPHLPEKKLPPHICIFQMYAGRKPAGQTQCRLTNTDQQLISNHVTVVNKVHVKSYLLPPFFLPSSQLIWCYLDLIKVRKP